MNPNLAVIILTFNEEENIAQALDSVCGWASEVWVLDSFSTDRTVEIAGGYPCRIAQHAFEDYSKQRNHALSLPIESEWILFLDADEWLSPELKDEIARVIEAGPEHDGFYIKYRFIWMGRWIRRGYYPTWLLRLFRRGKARCEDRAVNEHVIVDGSLGYLENDLIHQDRKSVTRWVARHNEYATREAAELFIERPEQDEVEANLFGTQTQRKRWIRSRVWNRLPPLVRPFGYFSYRYFLRGGFLDGKEAFLYHFLQGLWFPLLIDVKYLEMKASAGAPRSIPNALVRKVSLGAGKGLANVRVRGIPRLLYLTAPLVVGRGVQMLECAAGFRITVEARDYFGCMMLYGRYAPEIVSLFRDIVAPGDSVIDVGAQIGYLTCHLASLVGPSGRVHSFEPDPNALGRLRAAVKENGFSWVEIFPMAAGDTEGEIRFHVSQTVGWSTAVSGTHLADLTETRVPTARIDDLAARGQIRRPVKLVKIDVEGFECAVLDGMQALIATDRPFLVVEVNPSMLGAAGRTAADLLDRIRRHDYRIYGISEARGVLSGGRVHLSSLDAADRVPSCDVLCAPAESTLVGALGLG